jgi:stage V sporulation protein S
VQLRVSSSSSPNAVSVALIKALVAGEHCTISAIGAAAINQAMKAAAVARGELAKHGLALLLEPGFEPVTIDGERKVSLVFGVVTVAMGANTSSGVTSPSQGGELSGNSTVIDLTDAAMMGNQGRPVIDIRAPTVHHAVTEQAD